MTEIRELVCINCPMGCRLSVTLSDGQVEKVEGNTCPRGAQYAKDECTAPKRVVTTLARVENRTIPLSVKTSSAIPKELIFDTVNAIREITVSAPVSIGDVVLENVCGTGVSVVATMDMN